MRVYSGYLEQDGSFNAANFEVRTYVIEQWDGIDTNGITKITAKDILKPASDDRAVAPKSEYRKITLDMTTSTTSVNLTPLTLAQIMAQAVMFVLALKSWHLRGQVTHSRLHAHKKEQQQVHTNKATQCSCVIR